MSSSLRDAVESALKANDFQRALDLLEPVAKRHSERRTQVQFLIRQWNEIKKDSIGGFGSEGDFRARNSTLDQRIRLFLDLLLSSANGNDGGFLKDNGSGESPEPPQYVAEKVVPHDGSRQDTSAGNQSATKAGPDYVLLVHGIRTRATWMNTLSVLIEADRAMTVIPISYGRFDALKFLCPVFFRRRPVRRVLTELRSVRERHKDCRIAVIAHSFGTYCVVKALDEPDIVVDRMIFCGSVAPADFQVAKFRSQLYRGGPEGKEPAILNDCSPKDIWPILASILTFGYSPTGVYGFRTDRIKDRVNDFEHSQYFSEEFMSKYWIPFIRDGVVVPTNSGMHIKPAPDLWYLAWVKWVIWPVIAFGFLYVLRIAFRAIGVL